MAINTAARLHMGAPGSNGHRRENQEDGAVCANLGDRALLVAIDGMGGPAAGEEATRITRQVLSRLAGKHPSERALLEAFQEADAQVLEFAQANHARGMGCVATAAWIDQAKGKLFVGHIGDTRIYIRTQDGYIHSTMDHSGINKDFPEGMPESQRLRRPDNNYITRHLGGGDGVDILTFDLEVPCAFLLCSDGLTDALHEEIARMILDGLWCERSYDQIAKIMLRVHEIHTELYIQDEKLLVEIMEIILRNCAGSRTCRQVCDDLIEACLLYQPKIKTDNICAIVAFVTP